MIICSQLDAIEYLREDFSDSILISVFFYNYAVKILQNSQNINWLKENIVGSAIMFPSDICQFILMNLTEWGWM